MKMVVTHILRLSLNPTLLFGQNSLMWITVLVVFHPIVVLKTLSLIDVTVILFVFLIAQLT